LQRKSRHQRLPPEIHGMEIVMSQNRLFVKGALRNNFRF
jgi:hypothetical protein